MKTNQFTNKVIDILSTEIDKNLRDSQSAKFKKIYSFPNGVTPKYHSLINPFKKDIKNFVKPQLNFIEGKEVFHFKIYTTYMKPDLTLLTIRDFYNFQTDSPLNNKFRASKWYSFLLLWTMQHRNIKYENIREIEIEIEWISIKNISNNLEILGYIPQSFTDDEDEK